MTDEERAEERPLRKARWDNKTAEEKEETLRLRAIERSVSLALKIGNPIFEGQIRRAAARAAARRLVDAP